MQDTSCPSVSYSNKSQSPNIYLKCRYFVHCGFFFPLILLKQTKKNCMGAWIGGELWGRMDTCICIAESLCCPPETITTLLIRLYPNIKFKSFKNIALKCYLFHSWFFLSLLKFCVPGTHLCHLPHLSPSPGDPR